MPQIVKTGTNGVTTNVEAQDKSERGKALRQVVAAFVANIGTINTGLIFGFSAVVIPQLMAPSTSIKIDESQASWIGEFLIYICKNSKSSTQKGKGKRNKLYCQMNQFNKLANNVFADTRC